MARSLISLFFFFNDTATTEIYTLSLHDALPISAAFGKWHLGSAPASRPLAQGFDQFFGWYSGWLDAFSHRYYQLGSDRKSTRLNSSHLVISYAVFCLKKKT